MLDLSMLTTEECVYPKCEGEFICAATPRCVARKAKDVGSLIARLASPLSAWTRRRSSGKPYGVAWYGGVDEIAPEASTVGSDKETGAAVRTAWDVGPRRGAGFTSIQ